MSPDIAQNADPLGKGDKFWQGLDLHFLHYLEAMSLDCTFATAQRAGDVLVGVAANDKCKDFALARRQCCDMSANLVQFARQAARHFMTRNRPLDCLQKLVR